MDNLTAVILAGGRGERLRPVIQDYPKPLALIKGRPFIFYLFDQIITAGISKAILCTGFMGDKIREEAGCKYSNLKLIYSHEDRPLGTGGAILKALPLIETEYLLVLNGDSYVDLNLCNYFQKFMDKGLLAGMALIYKSDTSRYGYVEIDSSGRVNSFCEKQKHINSGWINGGVYLFHKNSLLDINSFETVSLEYDILPDLVNAGIYGYCCEGKFIDIGTPESFKKAETFFISE